MLFWTVAFINLFSKTSSDGDQTPTLDDLFECFTIFTARRDFWLCVCNLNLPFTSFLKSMSQWCQKIDQNIKEKMLFYTFRHCYLELPEKWWHVSLKVVACAFVQVLESVIYRLCNNMYMMILYRCYASYYVCDLFQCKIIIKNTQIL